MIPDNLFLRFLVCLVVSFFIRLFIFQTGFIFFIKKWFRSIEDRFHVHQFFRIPEFNESFQVNQLYGEVLVYVNSLAGVEDSESMNLFSGKRSNAIVIGFDYDQTIHDTFLGARVSWSNEKNSFGFRTFVLKIRKKDKRRILRPYFQHIHSIADEHEIGRDLKLYTNTTTTADQIKNERWRSVPFLHPSTLDTIAMDTDLKSKIKSDLESFLKSNHYYHRLGRVWKRSYLLCGPSGTGKSSFVAAVAKFLCYDVYDIDLSKVLDDSDLKSLFLQTTKRSVIVIEDLDRFINGKSTSVTVSVSGILNFMDGILSCCGEERIMIFTMNSKDHIDPAILRPGRIDVHIHFPLCDFSAFKSLANSYLGIKEHKLFPQVEEVFQTGATLSQAEIGEIMIANRSSPSRALKTVITALQSNVDGRFSTKFVRRLPENASARQSPSPETVEPGGVICRESVHTVREFRKLYGLLRMKSNHRRSGSFDLSTQKDS